MYIPRGLAPLSLLLLEPHFRASISCCWIATACRLHYLKLSIYGRRPTLPAFHWVQRSPANCHIPCSSTNGFNMTVMSRIPVKVHPIKRWGKEVVFVTEPHAKLNAGFVGLFASGHPAIFNWAQWNAETKHLNEREFEERCSHTAGLLTSAYWTLVSQYLCRRLSSHELSLEVSKAWTDGTCTLPTLGTVAQHSIDVIIAWALIGEKSSRVLFPG